MNGPGKYDELCTIVRKQTGAQGVIVMIFNGSFGDGFAVQVPPELLPNLPRILRSTADQIEQSNAQA